VVSLDDTVADVQGNDINTVDLDGNTLIDSILTPSSGKTLSDLDGENTIIRSGKVKVSLLVVVIVLTFQGLEVRITPSVANLSRSSLDLDTGTSSSPSSGTNLLESQDEAGGARLGTTEWASSGDTSTSNNTSTSDGSSTSNSTSTSDHTSTSNDTTNSADDFASTTAANGGTATNTSNDGANTAGNTGTRQTALFNNASLSGSEDTASTDSSLGLSGISNREAQGSN